MLAAVSPIWPAVSGIVALAGALGVAYAVFTSARVTKTIDLYEIENKALGQSVARQTADIAILQERVTTLEQENKVLRNVVTGKEAVEQLSQYAREESVKRRQEHTSVMEAVRVVETLDRDILGQLRDLWRQLSGRPSREPGTGDIGR